MREKLFYARFHFKNLNLNYSYVYHHCIHTAELKQFQSDDLITQVLHPVSRFHLSVANLFPYCLCSYSSAFDCTNGSAPILYGFFAPSVCFFGTSKKTLLRDDPSDLASLCRHLLSLIQFSNTEEVPLADAPHPNLPQAVLTFFCVSNSFRCAKYPAITLAKQVLLMALTVSRAMISALLSPGSRLQTCGVASSLSASRKVCFPHSYGFIPVERFAESASTLSPFQRTPASPYAASEADQRDNPGSVSS